MDSTHQSHSTTSKSTTETFIRLLLDKQHKKYDPNVVSKLNEFIVKFGSDLIDESKSLAQHACREHINEDDARYDGIKF